MPKLDPIEQALNKLGALKTAPPTPELIDELRDFLCNRSNLVVAKAAKISGEGRLTNLIPDLVAAFHKRMADPQRLDKRCAAITEIVVALYEMDYVEPDVYRKGITHIQMEPSWGGSIDTAAQLRGLCAQGIVRTTQPDALAAAVSLLIDPETPARIGAVRALASNGGESGALVLRLKILTGDSDPEVLAECFAGLLAGTSAPGRAGDDALDFVARYADSEDDAIAEAAILALGATRSPKAIAILKEKWERTLPGPLKKILLLALTTSRSEDALTFLLIQLETAPASSATEVLTALASQHPADRVRQSIEATLTRRADKSLLATFHQTFPT
jgi:HEAT repeats